MILLGIIDGVSDIFDVEYINYRRLKIHGKYIVNII